MSVTTKSANEIIPGIWVGDQYAAKNKSFFDKNNIKAVVNCTTDLPNYFNHSLCYMKLDIDDSLKAKDINKMTKILANTIDFIKIHKKSPILIHCHAGIQRSATVCAAYMFHLGMYNGALDRIVDHMVRKRGVIFYGGRSLNFQESLLKYIGRHRSY